MLKTFMCLLCAGLHIPSQDIRYINEIRDTKQFAFMNIYQSYFFLFEVFKKFYSEIVRKDRELKCKIDAQST